MRTSPPPAQSPPSWPHCGHGAAPATDPIGCPGIHVPSYTACLAHLDETDRDAYLASLTPGADIDHRGTPFTEELLAALLHALHDPTTRTACFGAARFEQAQFSGAARFKRARFSGGARFELAEFSGVAQFNGAQFSNLAHFGEAEFSRTAEFAWVKFSGGAWFGQAKFSAGGQFGDAQFFDTAYFPRTQFSGDAWFSQARFSGAAQFQEAEFFGGAVFEQAQFSGDGQFERTQFSRTAWFGGARFSGAARFERAKFSDAAEFAGAQFTSDALFGQAWFTVMSSFGLVVCAKGVDLSGAVFEAPVTLEIAARQVRCERTRWESTATLRLRYASVNLDHAALSFPVAVTAHPVPFTTNAGAATAVQESSLAGHNDGVRVVSVRGVDAAHLMLTDTDLSDCLFSGAFHLDQLRLEGRCTFALTPQGLHFRRRIWPYWWSRRRTLAEEHHWRAHTSGQPIPPVGQDPSPRHWRTGPHHPNPDHTPDPEDVAALYRQLRKAFEDGKNEPGAADFYYGEMEMRRHQPPPPMVEEQKSAGGPHRHPTE
ncbi:pentapeptide repeat-containing protein [Streptomyces ipomoeae]|uniref:Pentapeptide repeat-containing protein n=1 Tax=Streptomyces ipomoeae TaxID=103232 RepID=A0AAE8VSW3_9ACTN|nr:pentapeptide repeat-containing protein [Streptomyces ipomoeae]TQE15643.1 pentapeptide repeat-containing protein [Streptomyces ipomoeae]